MEPREKNSSWLKVRKNTTRNFISIFRIIVPKILHILFRFLTSLCFRLSIYQRKIFAKTLNCSFHLGFFTYIFKWICDLQVKPIPLRQQQFLHDLWENCTQIQKILFFIVEVIYVKLWENIAESTRKKVQNLSMIVRSIIIVVVRSLTNKQADLVFNAVLFKLLSLLSSYQRIDCE